MEFQAIRPRYAANVSENLLHGGAALLSLVMVTSCAEDDPPACEEQRNALETADAVSALGFSMSDAIERISSPKETVEWNPDAPDMVANTTTEVVVEFRVLEGTIEEVKAKKNAVEGDVEFVCSDHVESEVEVRVTTSDGAVDEVIQGRLDVWPSGDEPGLTQLRAEPISPTTLNGSLRFDDAPTGVAFSFYIDEEGATSGALSAVHQNDDQTGRSWIALLWSWGPGWSLLGD